MLLHLRDLHLSECFRVLLAIQFLLEREADGQLRSSAELSFQEGDVLLNLLQALGVEVADERAGILVVNEGHGFFRWGTDAQRTCWGQECRWRYADAFQPLRSMGFSS